MNDFWAKRKMLENALGTDKPTVIPPIEDFSHLPYNTKAFHGIRCPRCNGKCNGMSGYLKDAFLLQIGCTHCGVTIQHKQRDISSSMSNRMIERLDMEGLAFKAIRSFDLSDPTKNLYQIDQQKLIE